ncbi:protein quaking-A isoform X1 [Tachysurus ichikawai]
MSLTSFSARRTRSLIHEEQNRGKPNWEHLNEDLHVLITVEDTQARAEIKMRRAVEEVKKLLVPARYPCGQSLSSHLVSQIFKISVTVKASGKVFLEKQPKTLGTLRHVPLSSFLSSPACHHGAEEWVK